VRGAVTGTVILALLSVPAIGFLLLRRPIIRGLVVVSGSASAVPVSSFAVPVLSFLFLRPGFLPRGAVVR
jgi:hypothetical protein